MFKKALIVGLIVVLLAGVFGVITGPPIREEIRTQLYHRWALEFEETWECLDVIGVAENTEGILEVYLRGKQSTCIREAGAAFYTTEIYRLEKIAETLGYNVEIILCLYSPMNFPPGAASEYVIIDMTQDRSRGVPGLFEAPEYLILWEGRGE